MKKRKASWMLGSVFVFALILSLLVHIPAAWLFSQADLQAKLKPSKIELNAIQGSLWQGQAQLSYSENAFGELAWELHPLSLLLLQLDTELSWKYQDSQLKGNLTSSLLAPEKPHFVASSGILHAEDVSYLLSDSMPRYKMFLQGAKGQLEMTEVNVVFDLHQQWFASLTLQAQGAELELMGNRFPAMQLSANKGPDDKVVSAAISSSQADAWSLQLDAKLQKGFKYQGQLDVKAASANSVPDWAFALRKQSATHYTMSF